MGENAGSAIRIIPLLIMITFAPPATVSRVRAAMSASGSRNVGDVIPWSSAQITDTPARIDHPLQPHRLADLRRHRASSVVRSLADEAIGTRTGFARGEVRGRLAARR